MKKNLWYQLTPDETARILHTDLKNGMKRRDLKAALRRDGDNIIYPISRNLFYDGLKRILLDFTTILLLAVALIAAAFDVYSSAALLAYIVLFYLILSVGVYIRSQQMLESMERYTLPVVRVMREGKIYMVEQKKLVRGDLVFLHKGDIVPADLRLIASEHFVTQEDNLFDVQTFTEKNAAVMYAAQVSPDLCANMAYASTLVVQGEATGIVVETGEDALVCVLGKNAPVISHEKISAMESLRRFSRIWSLCMLGVIFLLTALHLVLHGGVRLFDAFLMSLSYAVSSMSEMLVPFGCIVIACGIYGGIRKYRDVNSGYVIKKPIAIDRLRQLTCLVLPKEGVFTAKEYDAELICTSNHTYKVVDTQAKWKMERIALYALLSTGQYGPNVIADREQYAKRSTEDVSIIAMAKKMNLYNSQLDREYPLLDHLEKGENSRFFTSLVRHGQEVTAIVRGGPMDILSRCGTYVSGGETRILDEKTRNRLINLYRKLARQTMHIVAIASKKSAYNNLRFADTLQQNMVFEGFVVFRVPFLRGVGQSIQKCRRAGIKLILLAENGSEENYYFAKHLGIIRDDGEVLQRADYEALVPDIKQQAVSYYKMYCGLTAAQQSEVIHNLRLNGERVGFLGHDLSDLQMMRQANVTFTRSITISAGRRRGVVAVNNDLVTASTADIYAHQGCEALKFASDVIVSDVDAKGNGGFNAIADAIAGAKLIDRNLMNVVRYLFTSQIARLLLVVVSAVCSVSLITPVQLAVWGLIFDLLSVFIFAFERPVEEEVLAMRNSAKDLLQHPGRMFRYCTLFALIWALPSLFVYFVPLLFANPPGALARGGAAFLAACVMQLLVLLCYKRDRWLFRRGVRFSGIFVLYFLLMLEFLALCFLLPNFGAVLGLYAPGSLLLRLVLLTVAVGAALLEVTKYFYYKKDLAEVRKAEKKQKKHHAKHKEDSVRPKHGKKMKKQQKDDTFSDISAAIDGYHGRYIAGIEPEDRVTATSGVYPGKGETLQYFASSDVAAAKQTNDGSSNQTKEFDENDKEILKSLFSESNES